MGNSDDGKESLHNTISMKTNVIQNQSGSSESYLNHISCPNPNIHFCWIQEQNSFLLFVMMDTHMSTWMIVSVKMPQEQRVTQRRFLSSGYSFAPQRYSSSVQGMEMSSRLFSAVILSYTSKVLICQGTCMLTSVCMCVCICIYMCMCMNTCFSVSCSSTSHRRN